MLIDYRLMSGGECGSYWGEAVCMYMELVAKPERKNQLGRPGRR